VNLPGGEGVIEGGTGASFGGALSPDNADNSGSLKYVRIEFPSSFPAKPGDQWSYTGWRWKRNNH
jgi:hypothetical protein